MDKIIEIRDALETLQQKKNSVLPKESELFSEELKQAIAEIDLESKKLEESLKSALEEKYSILADSNDHVPDYSKTDFIKDLKTSYNNVIEKLQKRISLLLVFILILPFTLSMHASNIFLEGDLPSGTLSCSNVSQSKTYNGWFMSCLKDEFGDPDYSMTYIGQSWPCLQNNLFKGELFVRIFFSGNRIGIEFTIVEGYDSVYLPEVSFVASYKGQKFSSPMECSGNWALVKNQEVAKKLINILESGTGTLKLSLSRTDAFGSKKNWVTSISLPTKCKTAWNILRRR